MKRYHGLPVRPGVLFMERVEDIACAVYCFLLYCLVLRFLGDKMVSAALTTSQDLTSSRSEVATRADARVRGRLCGVRNTNWDA